MGLAETYNHRILVVDDNINICQIIQKGLSTQYEVDYATSISKASQHLLSNRYSLIILDYVLNDKLDGIQLSKELKQLFPLTQIIMITGHTNFDLTKRAINEGSINYFIEKPFNLMDLKNKIDKSIDEFESDQETIKLLQSKPDRSIPQEMLQNLFDQTQIYVGNAELISVIVSQDSLPIYSYFDEDSQYLNQFTDTLFSGFMSALNMVGKEAFTTGEQIKSLKFGEMVISFARIKDFQIAFILHISNLEMNKIEDHIGRFMEKLHQKFKTNDSFITPISIEKDEFDTLIKDLSSSLN